MENQTVLRNALKANGIFSMLSALAAIFFAGTILAVNEMAGGNGIVFGVQLILFGAFVLFNAFRKGVSKIMVIIIVVLDVLYVLQSAAVLATKWGMLSAGGITLITISTIAVACFAFYQSVGLKMALK